MAVQILISILLVLVLGYMAYRIRGKYLLSHVKKSLDLFKYYTKTYFRKNRVSHFPAFLKVKYRKLVEDSSFRYTFDGDNDEMVCQNNPIYDGKYIYKHYSVNCLSVKSYADAVVANNVYFLKNRTNYDFSIYYDGGKIMISDSKYVKKFFSE